jgi:hypothetical protein
VSVAHEDRRRERQDRARRHPLRLLILAQAQRPGQSLDPRDIRRELPKRPAVAVIEYHLRVLREAGLILVTPPTRALDDRR